MVVEHPIVAALDRIASFLTPLLQLAVVAVLWRQRSLRLFYVFVAYLLSDTARTLTLWCLGGSTYADIYRTAWIYSEPLMLAFHVALVVEVIRRLYKAYPGINSFANIVLLIALLIALLLTGSSAPLDIKKVGTTRSDQILLRLFQVERVLDLWLCLIVAVTVALFPSSHYGKRVRQHGFLLSALFASASAGFYAINYGFDSDIAGLLTVAVQTILYGMWIYIFLAPEPEPLAVPSPEEIARVEQLNSDLLSLTRWLTK